MTTAEDHMKTHDDYAKMDADREAEGCYDVDAYYMLGRPEQVSVWLGPFPSLIDRVAEAEGKHQALHGCGCGTIGWACEPCDHSVCWWLNAGFESVRVEGRVRMAQVWRGRR